LPSTIRSFDVSLEALRRTCADGHRGTADAFQGPRLGRGSWPSGERQVIHTGDVRDSRQVLRVRKSC